MALAYIALGSNLGEPLLQLESACRALDAIPRCRLQARSSPWRSRPVGPQDQPHFVNAVVGLDTELPPLALLDALQTVEADHGRRREKEQRWGPRMLDLDLLLMGSLRLRERRLTLPHPRMAERHFVLVPLAEIASPDLSIPGQGRLETLLAALGAHDMERLEWAA